MLSKYESVVDNDFICINWSSRTDKLFTFSTSLSLWSMSAESPPSLALFPSRLWSFFTARLCWRHTSFCRPGKFNFFSLISSTEDVDKYRWWTVNLGFEKYWVESAKEVSCDECLHNIILDRRHAFIHGSSIAITPIPMDEAWRVWAVFTTPTPSKVRILWFMIHELYNVWRRVRWRRGARRKKNNRQLLCLLALLLDCGLARSLRAWRQFVAGGFWLELIESFALLWFYHSSSDSSCIGRCGLLFNLMNILSQLPRRSACRTVRNFKVFHIIIVLL